MFIILNYLFFLNTFLSNITDKLFNDLHQHRFLLPLHIFLHACLNIHFISSDHSLFFYHLFHYLSHRV